MLKKHKETCSVLVSWICAMVSKLYYGLLYNTPRHRKNVNFVKGVQVHSPAQGDRIRNFSVSFL
ncbi:hypothetical protein HMPREF1989_01459 [Porphyromonas gingivalis F0566]|nr:hypothetical protein HMPREF1989_01459 [Porphyromonas gingivalis F0566]